MKTKKGDYIHLVEGYGGRWAIAKQIDGWWYSNFWPNTFHLYPTVRALTLQELVVAEGIATFASAQGAYKRYRQCGKPDMNRLPELWASMPIEERATSSRNLGRTSGTRGEDAVDAFAERLKLWQCKAGVVTESIERIKDKVVVMLEEAYQAGRKGA